MILLSSDARLAVTKSLSLTPALAAVHLVEVVFSSASHLNLCYAVFCVAAVVAV